MPKSVVSSVVVKNKSSLKMRLRTLAMFSLCFVLGVCLRYVVDSSSLTGNPLADSSRVKREAKYVSGFFSNCRKQNFVRKFILLFTIDFPFVGNTVLSISRVTRQSNW